MASLDFDNEKSAFRDFYDGNRDTLQGAVGSFKTLIKSLLLLIPDAAISNVEGRVKDREECLRKFTRKYRTTLENTKTPYTILEKITDLIGLRVVCLYEDDVERVRDAISKEFEVLDITDKIAQVEGTESSFGYKGLHLDLQLNAARAAMAEYQTFAPYPFELQIRTVVQDSWSILDHKIKYKKSIPNLLKRRINTLAALFELADREFRAIRDATDAELEQAEKIYPAIEEETAAVEDGTEENNEHPQDVEPRRYAPLNAFNFLRIAQHFFPEFEFEPHKVDGFTQEITSFKPDISRGKFNFYLRETISTVKRYQTEFEATGDTMNPFTIMRHCLYAGDPAVFASILTDTARARFDAWLLTSEKQNEDATPLLTAGNAEPQVSG
ncbi:(p)ppGpp synthetase [Sinorhizobium meliloti]|uniref:GTP pyrophosphokinase n=1 Tax=Rhizobium meliloti TaxID=382 RepID=UPI000FDAEC57|nr:(p)ppGpp synthetase [Sinorhizobium meliloti]RVI66072.1 (p)ppGpp synthetase [Sinorhizobium meliloti]